MTHTPRRRPDFKVADLSLAEFGRKEIQLAEHEMPGLMAIREEFGDDAAADGRPHHRLAAHDDPDRGADRDAGRARRRGALGELQHLLDPGPRRRRGRRRPDGTADDPTGVPVFAWKGETLEEYWWCTEQALRWPDGEGPNMILDDGGDATLLVHKGVEYEAAGAVPDPTTADSEECSDHPRAAASARSPRTRSAGPRSPQGIKGVTEETTTGVHRLYQLAETRRRCCSRRSTSTTRSPSRSSTTSTAAATR